MGNWFTRRRTVREWSFTTSLIRIPSADKAPGYAGTITLGIRNAWARSHACMAPAPAVRITTGRIAECSGALASCWVVICDAVEAHSLTVVLSVLQRPSVVPAHTGCGL